jgi:glycosyltransferase involved in cell wall biosynthesis
MEGITVWRPPFLPLYPLHVHFHSLFVNRLLLRLEPELDLLHLHSPLIKHPGTRLPTLLTVHSLMKFASAAILDRNLLSLLIRLQTPISVRLEKELLTRSHTLTTVASSTTFELEEYGLDLRPVKACGNGVDIDAFVPASCVEPTANPTILTASRLGPGKGLGDLVSCSAVVALTCPDVRFLIAGAGPLANELQTQIRVRGLEKNVVLLGYISNRKRMIEQFQQAAIYLHPSHYEGLPTVLLEAMACGRPVVATAVSGALDVIRDGENGLLVPPRAPEQMAEAILRLLKEPDLARRLGAAARRTVVERYSWDVIGKAYLEQYRRILTGGARL